MMLGREGWLEAMLKKSNLLSTKSFIKYKFIHITDRTWYKFEFEELRDLNLVIFPSWGASGNLRTLH